MTKLPVIMNVFGTRPDAIKMAPVVKELQRYPDRVRVVNAVTGQHREMLDQVLRVFEIQPDYDLNVMQHGQSLSAVTIRVLQGLEPIIEAEQPAVIIAQGDTTTTFVASLAALYHKAQFGHVEAGLRSGDLYNPFPEEANRKLAGALAAYHWAPTPQARENLLREGINPSDIWVTGNTGIDALLSIAGMDYRFDDPTLQKAVERPLRTVLITAHRRENWGEPMEAICRAARRLIEALPDTQLVFPMHRNPIVRETAHRILDGCDRVVLAEPPDYVPFVKLMQASTLILTDSGGVQEEAPSLGKPVLVMRRTTERQEGVDAGTARLVGTDEETIFREAMHLLTDRDAYERMARAVNPYGDGAAAQRIRETLFSRLGVC